MYLGDLAGFVVSSQNRDTVLETDLEADQQAHGLDGVVASEGRETLADMNTWRKKLGFSRYKCSLFGINALGYPYHMVFYRINFCNGS